MTRTAAEAQTKVPWHRLPLDHWYLQGRPQYSGGNDVALLRGGDQLFPAMCAAIQAAQREVWLATYIFNDDPSVMTVVEALLAAGARGVKVQVVVDGFGAKDRLATIRARLEGQAGIAFLVYRPASGWRSWLQPDQMRRLHQKLCAVDGDVAFVGGINLIDDRYDLAKGWLDAPRLDFAVALAGPVALPVQQMVQALAARVQLGRDWPEELVAIVRSAQPAVRAREMLSHLQEGRLPEVPPMTSFGDLEPMQAAFVVRDNLRQRRTIELSYIEALRRARVRIDLVSPYFYPTRSFLRVLRRAAQRGVRVRLLMQGRWDYVWAAMAARALYEELRDVGVEVYEYTPAPLHAKVALVDEQWATVGSSNIDPISLLVNLEANVIVRDPGFVRSLALDLDRCFAEATLVGDDVAGSGLWPRLRNAVVALGARAYLRFAGVRQKY